MATTIRPGVGRSLTGSTSSGSWLIPVCTSSWFYVIPVCIGADSTWCLPVRCPDFTWYTSVRALDSTWSPYVGVLILYVIHVWFYVIRVCICVWLYVIHVCIVTDSMWSPCVLTGTDSPWSTSVAGLDSTWSTFERGPVSACLLQRGGYRSMQGTFICDLHSYVIPVSIWSSFLHDYRFNVIWVSTWFLFRVIRFYMLATGHDGGYHVWTVNTVSTWLSSLRYCRLYVINVCKWSPFLRDSRFYVTDIFTWQAPLRDNSLYVLAAWCRSLCQSRWFPYERTGRFNFDGWTRATRMTCRYVCFVTHKYDHCMTRRHIRRRIFRDDQQITHFSIFY